MLRAMLTRPGSSSGRSPGRPAQSPRPSASRSSARPTPCAPGIPPAPGRGAAARHDPIQLLPVRVRECREQSAETVSDRLAAGASGAGGDLHMPPLGRVQRAGGPRVMGVVGGVPEWDDRADIAGAS